MRAKPSSRVLAGAAILISLLGTAPAPAADDPDRKQDPPRVKWGKDAERRKDRELIENAERIMAKLKAGEELTPKERKTLARVKLLHARRRADQERALRDRMQRGWRPGGALWAPGQKPGPPHRLRHDRRLNVKDAAYYQIAEIHLAQRRGADAVAALERLVQKSPDPLAVSLTHLNLGDLYHKELAHPKKAIEAYKKVRGEFAPEAHRQLARMFEEVGQIDEAAQQLENIAEHAKDPVQKVVALQQLADLLRRNGREDEAVAALQRLIQAVDYDQAAKIAKTLRDEQDRREKMEREEYERARGRLLRNLQQRWRKGRAKVGLDVDLRPLQVRPREPKKRGVRPAERPIRPEPDHE